MRIEFAESRPSTVGIEWELAIVDRNTGDLVDASNRLLDHMTTPSGERDPRYSHELLLNTIEVISGVHNTIGTAVTELRELVARLSNVAGDENLALMCSGTHPFAQWFDQATTPSERYDRLLERTQWWGRQMMVWGVHVHVGVDARDKALPIVNGLLRYFPQLQALSASSPFWGGTVTGYASNRALMFQQLPTTGLPWQLGTWANYEQYVEDLVETGIVTDFTEVRWDIRPSPNWGTVEMRACDGLSTFHEVGAVAALIQCLVHEMSTALDAGREPMMLQPWFARENKWRAARYGMDARIIVDVDGSQRPVRDDIRDTVERLRPVAEHLGCSAELEAVLDIVRDGASYERQLRVAERNGGNLQSVVASLTKELLADLR